MLSASETGDPIATPTSFRTVNRTFSDFAATLATIRTDLSDLALDAAKPERSVMMRAAAALAMFESDMLRKAAEPTLPGEPIA